MRGSAMTKTGLARRLASLRAQTGSPSSSVGRPASDADQAGHAEDLDQRLRRLTSRRRRGDDQDLASRLQGSLVADGLIEIRTDQCLSDRALADGSWSGSGPPAELPETGNLKRRDWVFMDTETTGLAGGTGTLVFLLGLARFDSGRLHCRQYLCTRIGGEREMLRRGLEWCAGAALVSYNGKSFDRPLLDTRCRLQRLEPAWQQREHLDLLYTVRRAFERYWPDCRLQSAERQLLGLQRADDLPGAEAPAAWLAYVRSGDSDRLSGVLGHNRQDLLSLAELLPVLAAVHRNPSQWPADSLRISRAWRRAGCSERAIEILEQGPDEARNRHELARLYRRARNWSAARSIWEELAAQGDRLALEFLAKYHEHISRDLSAAQRYAGALPDAPARRQRQARIARKSGNNLPLPFG